MTGAEFRNTALELIELDEHFSKLNDQVALGKIKQAKMRDKIISLASSLRPAFDAIGLYEYIRVGSYVFWCDGAGEVCFTRLRSWFEIPSVTFHEPESVETGEISEAIERLKKRLRKCDKPEGAA